MRALIDCDILIYECSAVAEYPKDEPVKSFDHVIDVFKGKIREILDRTGADSYSLYVTGDNNFRFDVAKTKPYKGNRKQEKPYHYKNIKACVLAMPECVLTEGCEADDQICIDQMKCAKEHGVRQPLGNGSMIVDYDIWERYQGVTWHINNKGYAINDTGKGKTRKIRELHREIMGDKEGFVIDHINGDQTDNRRVNLRHCTVKENVRNQKHKVGGTSKHKGVSWDSSRNKWTVQVRNDEGIKHVGRFDCEETAARAYDEAAKEHHGEYARGNFFTHEVPEFKETVICSRDKDLRMVPFKHFGWESGMQGQFGPKHIDKHGYLDLSSNRKKISGGGMMFFYSQLLTGDSTDNIPGLKGYGDAKAYDALKDCKTEQEMFEAVQWEYEAVMKECWQEYMLEQGQLLWMVRERDEAGELVHWTIPTFEEEENGE